jgi:hypothetical protein
MQVLLQGARKSSQTDNNCASGGHKRTSTSTDITDGVVQHVQSRHEAVIVVLHNLPDPTMRT